MRKLACTFLLIAFIALELPYVGTGHATTANGSIYGNTVWTTAGSPYTLTSNVLVTNGATLTILPGVTVNLGIYSLQISGVLVAQGSANNVIYFSGVGNPSVGIFISSTASPSTISNASLNSVYVNMQQGMLTVSDDYFANVDSNPIIAVNGGQATISNNVINMGSRDGIDVFGGSALVSANVIVGQGNGYGVYTATSATITGNNITDCFSGIWSVGSSYIEQNNIVNNEHDGICSANPSSTIEFNYVAGNLCGVSGNGTIEYNMITSNSVGIWGPTSTGAISHNNILNNNLNVTYTQNIHMTFHMDVSATENWWGTADPDAINQTIWDYKNDTVHLGMVTFEPALNSPEQLAPSIPVLITVPTAPPTSTQSATATPSGSSSASSTPSPSSLHATPSPLQSYLPGTITPGPIVGFPQNSDLYSIIAIVAAFIVAAVIIVAINFKFGRAKSPALTKRRKR